MAQITISSKELNQALEAIGRVGSAVYSARKERGYIVLRLCGDKEPVKWKPPVRRRTPTKKKGVPKG